MKTNITDCGRFENERNDCTVRATAICLGITYSEAHAKLCKLGRKPGCRIKFKTCFQTLGLDIVPELSCMTLASALPEMQRGRFIVRIRRHVFAVIDGIIHDLENVNPRGRIKMVYTPRG